MTSTTLPNRRNETLLQPLELPVLLWMARKMPAWVTPDILTAFGFVGGCIAAGGYAACRWQPDCLWLASLGLLINWFGDSLDGNLARFRKIERPLYGLYLDQNLDAVAQLLFAIGIGLSGFIRFELSMFTLATFFLLSILSLVRAITSNVFDMAYGAVGLTELRIAFIVLNVIMYFYPPATIIIGDFGFKYPEIVSLAWATSMLIAFFTSFTSNLRRLSKVEPKRPVG
jgi:phosphatidylglycerophosphate synthase